MTSFLYANPYAGKNFYEVIFLFFVRFYQFVTLQINFEDLASDEIQILTLSVISISCALIGSFLVLRKMAMLANSISHTILVGIVLVYFLVGNPFHSQTEGTSNSGMYLLLLASLFMGIATSFLTEFLTKTMKLQEDASIGIVFTSLFALGITLVTLLTRSQHIGTELVTGNVDALQRDDLKLAVFVLLINLVFVVGFFKELLITSFDSFFGASLGFSVGAINYMVMTVSSFTITSSFRAVGVIMVLALLTGPVLAARLLTGNIKKMIALAMAFGALSSLMGVAFARHMLSFYSISLSTAGTTILSLSVIFCMAMLAFFYKQSIFYKQKAL